MTERLEDGFARRLGTALGAWKIACKEKGPGSQVALECGRILEKTIKEIFNWGLAIELVLTKKEIADVDALNWKKMTPYIVKEDAVATTVKVKRMVGTQKMSSRPEERIGIALMSGQGSVNFCQYGEGSFWAVGIEEITDIKMAG